MPDSVETNRMMLELTHPPFSIRRQCELVGLVRSTFYDQPAEESPLNLELMRRLDEQYLRTPLYGWPRMTAHLRRLGYPVNAKRVRRLLHPMGLGAISPQRRLSQPAGEHQGYPSRLRDLEIVRPNQVWSADITSVPMRCGFMYLMAILDW